MNSDRPIGIAGAGSIGCFVGGMLAAGGRNVALLARPRVIAEIEANGLRPTSFEGFDQTIKSNQLTLSENPSVFGHTGVVLVTVKSADTAGMADVIARNASPDVVIVSLQNGVGNVAVLRNRLPGRRVLGGMVPFNVIALGEGRFHRATSGDIVIEQDEAVTAQKLSVPGLTIRPTDNIEGVLWGKLLLNLNNALNALADLPLRRQLAQRPWRKLFADQMAEGLAAIRAEPAFVRAIAEIEAPTLLICGGRTRAPARRVVELLRKALPDARHHEIADAGHMSPLSHPADIAAAIQRHVGSIDAQRRSAA